jgi:hypothetical protein
MPEQDRERVVSSAGQMALPLTLVLGADVDENSAVSRRGERLVRRDTSEFCSGRVDEVVDRFPLRHLSSVEKVPSGEI